jgi:hypothetical protein
LNSGTHTLPAEPSSQTFRFAFIFQILHLALPTSFGLDQQSSKTDSTSRLEFKYISELTMTLYLRGLNGETSLGCSHFARCKGTNMQTHLTS